MICDMSSGDLVVRHWKRFGHDRLYAERSDGAKLGWWDLAADTGHPTSPELMAALVEAAEAWRAGRAPLDGSATRAVTDGVGEPQREAAPQTVPAGTVEAAPVEVTSVADAVSPAVERPWIDLALSQPGAAAREQAINARAAAPVKTTLARVLGVHTEERSWRIGADGEELVAAQLVKAARRDPRWRFLHAIPVGSRGSDIDHLVIGPGGVFTVNAKHHPGAKVWVGGNTVMVNGQRQPYVRNSRHEAERAARMLTAACGFEVPVEGLVVTVNAADVTIRAQPIGVSVTWRKNLAKWLLAHGDVLTVDAIDAIYETARRSTTWQQRKRQV